MLTGRARPVRRSHCRYRRRQAKQVWLARLEDPYHEVLLSVANSTSSEGNWLPFEHAGQLYVSYKLCPHRVLAVNVTTGVCTLAYETNRIGCNLRERGSASGMGQLPGENALGLGHFKRYVHYTHFFFERASQPPFPILRASDEFRFPTPFEDNVLRPLRTSGQTLPSTISDKHIQFALSLRRSPLQSGTVLAPTAVHAAPVTEDGNTRSGCAGRDFGDLFAAVGAADLMGFTTRIERGTFCSFTGWCECGLNAMYGSALSPALPGRPSLSRPAVSHQPSPLHSVLAAGREPSPLYPMRKKPTREFAIVIKGPLLPFTEDVISFYGRTLPADAVTIVFSHTNGSCFTPEVLDSLRRLGKRSPNFAWTINPEPPALGENFRNVQRESTYYGARFAVENFGARYIFMQRADSIFQRGSFLTDLAGLLMKAPPPLVPMPGGRVGMCPLQAQLTDVYGVRSTH